MRIEQLTFTRFLAALIIVVFHYGLDIPPFTQPSISFLFSNIGISYFFVLSGFVMVIAYGKSGKEIAYFNYYRNRFARVYPVYLFALLLSMLTMWICNFSITWDAVTMNLFILQSWFPKYPMLINRTGWTLSVEVLFYFSFPLLYNKLYLKFRLIPIAIGILSFWLLSQLLSSYLISFPFLIKENSTSHHLIYYFPLMHLNQFLIGNLFGIILFHTYERFQRNWDILLIIMLAGLAALLKFYIPHANYHNGFLALLFAFIILIISLNTGYITKINNNKISIFLGEISFGMYILQVPIHDAFYKSTKPFYYNHPFWFFYLYVITLILISAISYKYAETPLRKLLKK
jgi:peptidoglycan/LPS O-acetylase OafA/YrhL